MRYILPLLFLLGCQISRPAVPTMEVAAEATRKVEVQVTVAVESGPVVLRSSGTAWVVGHRRLITAGHVCPFQVSGLPVLASEFALISRFGSRMTAHVVKRADDPDLCLLETDQDLGAPLSLADAPPSWGESVVYVGAPLGLWGDGLAPMYRGHFIGRDMISAPAAGGASGSAVLGQRGVIGVLVAVDRRFSGATYIVPLETLREFLK